MTRADRPLELARGLLEPKHRRQLGAAWHLYLWLLSAKPYQNGFYLGGRPTSPAVIAAFIEAPERTVKRWIARLHRYGYIETERVRSGIRVRIVKARDWTGGKVVPIPHVQGQKWPRPGARSGPRLSRKSKAAKVLRGSFPSTDLLPQKEKEETGSLEPVDNPTHNDTEALGMSTLTPGQSRICAHVWSGPKSRPGRCALCGAERPARLPRRAHVRGLLSDPTKGSPERDAERVLDGLERARAERGRASAERGRRGGR